MNKAFFPLFFGILSGCASQQQQTADKTGAAAVITDSTKTRIDSMLRNYIDSGKVAGASALIFEKNKEVYFNAFGYADREAKKTMDRNTIVRIYSMTKPITGVALMKLYEQGAFQLDDSLAKYAPEFANMKVYKGVDAAGNLVLEKPKRPITIRDITRHTAGFADNPSLPGLGDLVRNADPMNPQNTLSQMAKKLGSLPLMFHPGDQWSYGPSVDVQAFLVERLSGKPFDQFVKENILEPLRMNNTQYVLSPADTNRFAALYRKTGNNQLDRVADGEANTFNMKDWPLKPGGWGLTSTVDDYMKFAQMLVNEGSLGAIQILKPETVKLMATNHLSDTISQRMWLPSKGSVGFGIDFAVRLREPATQSENHGIVGEFFWDGAASTLFWIDPVNDIAAVLLVQVVPFDGALHKQFRDAVYGPYQPGKVAGK